MEGKETVSRLLAELGVKFEHEVIEEGVQRFDLHPDANAEDDLIGLLFATEAGEFFRLMAFVDKLEEAQALDQLKGLMALNGDMPAGCFCMDPEDDLIYATVNIALAELTGPRLAEGIELMQLAQAIYDSEFYGDDEEPEA